MPGVREAVASPETNDFITPIVPGRPQPLLRDGLWSLASKISAQFFSLAISVVAARALGPEAFGRQSFIAFAELSLITAATGGLPTAFMRFVSEQHGRNTLASARTLFDIVWRIELCAAIAAAVLFVTVAMLGEGPPLAWLFAALVVLASVLHTVPSALLIGTQCWRQTTIIGFVTGCCATAATIVALVAGGGIASMFAIEAVAAATALLWTRRVALRLLRAAPSASPAPARESYWPVWRYALVASGTIAVGFIVTQRSELFFLKRFSGDVQIAYYSVAFAATAALSRLFDAFAAVLTPTVSGLVGAGDSGSGKTVSRRALRMTLQVSVPLAALTAVLGPRLLQVVYGQSMTDAGPVLIVLVLSLPLLALGLVSRALLHGFGRQRALLMAAIAGAAATLLFDAWLIPRWHALGAAVANSAAQVIYVVPILAAVIRRVHGLRIGAGPLAGLVAASLAIAAAASAGLSAATDAAGLLIGGVAGVASALVLLPLLRAIHADDIAWLRLLLQRALRAGAGAAP